MTHIRFHRYRQDLERALRDNVCPTGVGSWWKRFETCYLLCRKAVTGRSHLGNLGSTLMAILKWLTPEMRGLVTFDNVTFGHIGGVGSEDSVKSICHA